MEETVPTSISEGDTAWLLAATGLVALMTPGVGFFYSGLAGKEASLNTLMMAFASMAIVTLQWFVFGFALALGEGSPIIGFMSWAGMSGVGAEGIPAYGAQIPGILYAFFQCNFAAITPALISGGVVGRMRFLSFSIFVFLWTTLVYDPLAHWMWSNQTNDKGESLPLGWLHDLGAIDFAGGIVVHVSAGFSGMVAAYAVGRRSKTKERLSPHNVPLVLIGTTLLWFGWFGFNGGSALRADGQAARAIFNTHVSACAGMMTWMILEELLDQSHTPAGVACGVIAALVSITPACGWVYTWGAVIFGVVGSAAAYGATRLKFLLQFDDALDSFAIHGVAGIVGTLLAGVFATEELLPPTHESGLVNGNASLIGYQFLACAVCAGYSMLMTWIILKAIDLTIGLRVSEAVQDLVGVDWLYNRPSSLEDGAGSTATGPHKKLVGGTEASTPHEGMYRDDTSFGSADDVGPAGVPVVHLTAEDRMMINKTEPLRYIAPGTSWR